MIKRQPIKLWYTLNGVGVEGKPLHPDAVEENEYFLNNDLYLICTDIPGVIEIALLDDTATVYLMYKKHVAVTQNSMVQAKEFIRKNKRDNVKIVPIGRREYVVTHG